MEVFRYIPSFFSFLFFLLPLLGHPFLVHASHHACRGGASYVIYFALTTPRQEDAVVNTTSLRCRHGSPSPLLLRQNDVMTCRTSTSISAAPDHSPLYPILSRSRPRDSDTVLFGGGSIRSHEHEFLKRTEIQLRFSDGNFSRYSPSVYGTAIC